MKCVTIGFAACIAAMCGGAILNQRLKNRQVLEEIALPPPQAKGTMSLEETLAKRRSIRQFASRSLSLAQIGQLMWAAQGITDPARGFRTAPSAGALYPLEIYLVTPDGLYHYVPQGHLLERLRRDDPRKDLAAAGLDQEQIRQAALNIVIAAVVRRTEVKYHERAMRYIFIEIGHVAENILLQATALGLGSVPIGAFDDGRVARLLGLSQGEEALYIISLGYPP